MPRLTVEEATAGKPISTHLSLTTTWQTLLEAPDFDIPNDDPTSPLDRRIAPGQIEILTPILVANTITSGITVEVRILAESGATVPVAQLFPVAGRDTGMIRVQGQFLLKRLETTANGDRLQIRASASGVAWAWVSAIESQASEHIT